MLQSGDLAYGNNENGLWIYFYQNEVYWIISDEFKNSMSEECYVPCYIATYKQELLPSYNLVYGYDNIGFYIKDNLTEINGEPYYFVRRALPQSYPIAHISTGIFNQKEQKWDIYVQHSGMTQ